ncbi:MAG: hypothetical protein EOL97_16555 [Spirochaetia bacterium]|nr:hypothetical protein [Spirochaetia bacterium]
MNKKFISIIPKKELKKIKKNISLLDKIQMDLEIQVILYGSIFINNNKDYIILNKHKYNKKDIFEMILKIK